eukprot:UN05188
MQKSEKSKVTVFGYKKGSNSKSDHWKIFLTSNNYGGFYLSKSSSDGRNIAEKKYANTDRF